MSRNVFFFLISAFILKAGAKVSILFTYTNLNQTIFKIILSKSRASKIQEPFPLCGGANVKPFSQILNKKIAFFSSVFSWLVVRELEVGSGKLEVI